MKLSFSSNEEKREYISIFKRQVRFERRMNQFIDSPVDVQEFVARHYHCNIELDLARQVWQEIAGANG